MQAFAWIAHFELINDVKLQVRRFPFSQMIMINIEHIVSRILLVNGENNTACVHQLIQY